VRLAALLVWVGVWLVMLLIGLTLIFGIFVSPF
jgi:hypothetical protein